ncbi:putative reverse transcriptase domain-containing protein [Tanacetum coccineum]
MVEPESVKVDAYIRGLFEKIKGEVTSSRLVNLNEVVRMAHKLMEQKSQARNERILEGNKRKHKSRYCKEKSVATGANAQPVWTCYDCGEQGHTRNRCPKKFKQEETREVCGRAYTIKDAEPEKVVHIPYGNKTLTVESDKGMSRLKVISCIKDRKYIERGCHLFLAHVNEKKRLEDVPVIRDFPEVFPSDLPGLPPPMQVKFRIDMVPGDAPVARTLYRLAPSEMRELSVQLQELLEK